MKVIIIFMQHKKCFLTIFADLGFHPCKHFKTFVLCLCKISFCEFTAHIEPSINRRYRYMSLVIINVSPKVHLYILHLMVRFVPYILYHKNEMKTQRTTLNPFQARKHNGARILWAIKLLRQLLTTLAVIINFWEQICIAQFTYSQTLFRQVHINFTLWHK